MKILEELSFHQLENLPQMPDTWLLAMDLIRQKVRKLCHECKLIVPCRPFYMGDGMYDLDCISCGGCLMENVDADKLFVERDNAPIPEPYSMLVPEEGW